MRVSVIGCGHLGIPHAAAMAELGHEVIGVDVDQAKVDRLNAGQCPIYETGLPELLAVHTASGRLRFTTDIREAADFADLHFIGVGPPIDADGRSYDTAQVYGAVRQLAPPLTRPCTIVGKSTVTVGTTAQVTALAQRLAPAGQDVDVVWNPEFLREGHVVQDTLRPDRLIAGVTTAEGEEAICAVYAPILDAGVPIFVTDPQTAELAKGAANTFLGLKISYINRQSHQDGRTPDVRTSRAPPAPQTRPSHSRSKLVTRSQDFQTAAACSPAWTKTPSGSS
ncbi:nucleotide sugar dehydrogenase [Streptomyces sp. WM6372]|uniref:nucleotide sugar dehydrogenase n=1 Tax=Streptomyces sp. WM6372 TaxID=1415555 RepID=UPI000AA63111|nr:nucleotide sugar dehydrogenase [Streptomyces sp. WM6372]